MVYQKTVFRRIQAEINQIGRAAARERVPSYIEALYSLELEGRIFFYEQDQDGFPTRRVDTNIPAIGRFEPTMLIRNIVDASAWKNIEWPDNFTGGFFPPSTRSDLLGCKSLNELCAECDHNNRYNDSNNDGYYHAWVQRVFRVWHKNIDIRLSSHTGYGLYARRPLEQRIVLGEYTGVLVPHDDDLPNDQCVYQFDINIGHLQENEGQPVCWVDATKKGSIFRFMAHSCVPNAEVEQARIGTHHRVLAVRTIRPIKINEPITINYGAEWFKGEQRCYCGMKDGHHPSRERYVIEDSGSEYED